MVGEVPRGRWLSHLSPLQLLKAVKNETEAKGMREAHVRIGEGGRELIHQLYLHLLMVREMGPSLARSETVRLCVSTCVGWRRG